MHGLFNAYQNWQERYIDQKIVLDPNSASTSSSVSSTSNTASTSQVSTTTSVKVESSVTGNGTEEMEVQENKENHESPAKKVKQDM